MKDTIKLVITLVIICVIAGSLLAVVNDLTQEPIANALKKEKLAALMAVLPPCDNTPDSDTVEIEQDGQTWTFFIARKAGQYVGAAFQTRSSKGYGGDIAIMVGLKADGSISAIEILQQKETPGLGAKIAKPAFRKLFAGRSIATTRWKVKKDGGDIDQITAATISSRAVVGAIKSGIEIYSMNESQIRQTVAAQ